ncbi:MAG: DNA adenine methylase [Candidatus Kapaibacterium sp.]
MNNQLNIFQNQERPTKITNVASVPQRSPFRYPGGKTWLIPVVRKWLKQYHASQIILSEPFAGGGIVSLTAAFENLASKVIMIELDTEVAAVWETIFSDNNQWLADQIIQLDLTIENAQQILNKEDKDIREIALATILKNRIFHGGIMAKGSGLIKNGENGKGILSRWYPKTLFNRIRAIDFIKDKVCFLQGDAFEFLDANKINKDMCFFIDPPYFKAAKRLYKHYDINHYDLFKLASQIEGHFLMTYDDDPEIRELIDIFNLDYIRIPMKTTHHLEKYELLITDKLIEI